MSAKLHGFDLHSGEAVDYLIEWLSSEREALIAMARGRHVWGHYRYNDSLMFEYNEHQLKVEAAEEIADAIVYLARRLQII